MNTLYLQKYLEQIANKKAKGENEDFNTTYFSGGNFGDAYEIGVDDGEIFLAREILATYFEE